MKSQIFKKISMLVMVFLFLSAGGAQAVLADGSTAPNSGLGSGTSENWAGYASAQNGASYTAVSGNWIVPSPTVTANSPTATDATWVGIGGVTGQDLIQSGTQAVVQNDAVTYEAWVETLPNYQQIIPLTVNGGDSVSVSLNQISTGEWQLSFRDNTTGQNYSETLAYNSSLSSAEWIEEMPAETYGRRGLAFLPLDNFGTVNFTGGSTTINGNLTTIAGSGASQLTMIDDNIALATPSALSSDDESFAITRSNTAVAETEPQQPVIQIQIQRRSRGFRRNGMGMQGYTNSAQTGIRVSDNWRTFSFSFQNLKNRFGIK